MSAPTNKTTTDSIARLEERIKALEAFVDSMLAAKDKAATPQYDARGYPRRG